MKNKNRWLIYGGGILVLALGLTLNTKTGLGVSPILSLSFSASQIWGVSLGNTTLAVYCLFIAAEFVIRGKGRQWTDLLQLPFSLVFSRVLNLFDAVFPYDPADHGLGPNLLVLTAAVLVTGVGIAMTVNMHLVPNPGDGIVQAMADRFGKGQGFMKNCFDFCCVMITILMCLAAVGEVMGIGIGTLVAMVGVGRAVALVNHFFEDKMLAAAGMAVQRKA